MFDSIAPTFSRGVSIDVFANNLSAIISPLRPRTLLLLESGPKAMNLFSVPKTKCPLTRSIKPPVSFPVGVVLLLDLVKISVGMALAFSPLILPPSITPLK